MSLKGSIKNKIIKESEFKKIELEIKKSIEKDVEWSLSQEDPNPSNAHQYVYSPTSIEVETSKNPISQEKVVMVDAINHALNEEMDLNPKMIIYGQDIADPKGGVFTATKGLSSKYGKDRVFNSPLAESSS